MSAETLDPCLLLDCNSNCSTQCVVFKSSVHHHEPASIYSSSLSSLRSGCEAENMTGPLSLMENADFISRPCPVRAAYRLPLSCVFFIGAWMCWYHWAAENNMFGHNCSIKNIFCIWFACYLFICSHIVDTTAHLSIFLG